MLRPGRPRRGGPHGAPLPEVLGSPPAPDERPPRRRRTDVRRTRRRRDGRCRRLVALHPDPVGPARDLDRGQRVPDQGLARRGGPPSPPPPPSVTWPPPPGP